MARDCSALILPPVYKCVSDVSWTEKTPSDQAKQLILSYDSLVAYSCYKNLRLFGFHSFSECGLVARRW
jgi:hypothetical protein